MYKSKFNIHHAFTAYVLGSASINSSLDDSSARLLMRQSVARGRQHYSTFDSICEATLYTFDSYNQRNRITEKVVEQLLSDHCLMLNLKN